MSTLAGASHDDVRALTGGIQSSICYQYECVNRYIGVVNDMGALTGGGHACGTRQQMIT